MYEVLVINLEVDDDDLVIYTPFNIICVIWRCKDDKELLCAMKCHTTIS